MSALAESLRGLSRIIGVTGNWAATGRFVQHRDALAVQVVARPPEPHCFELWAWVQWGSQHPLIATTVGSLTVTLIAYIFKRAAGQSEEMKHLRGALERAITELAGRDQATVDRLLATVDKMADALRPAAGQAVAPIGDTAKTLAVGDVARDVEVTLGTAEKQAILSEPGMEIGE